tara:strand:- start:2541 stop:2780 length:240 start_codon:yes stop_codon:yes gene_type:complete
MPSSISTSIYIHVRDRQSDGGGDAVACRKSTYVGPSEYPEQFTLSFGDAHVFLTPARLLELYEAVMPHAHAILHPEKQV